MQSGASPRTRTPFRPPWYVFNVNLLNDEKGLSFSRHCEGCHNPIALAAGALTDGGPRSRPYDKDGITCMVCHSIQSVNKYGTGSYVLAEPAVMVDENGKPIHGPVPDAEILAHLDRHSAAVMKPFYSTPGVLRRLPQGRSAHDAQRLQVAARVCASMTSGRTPPSRSSLRFPSTRSPSSPPARPATCRRSS